MGPNGKAAGDKAGNPMMRAVLVVVVFVSVALFIIYLSGYGGYAAEPMETSRAIFWLAALVMLVANTILFSSWFTRNR